MQSCMPSHVRPTTPAALHYPGAALLRSSDISQSGLPLTRLSHRAGLILINIIITNQAWLHSTVIPLHLASCLRLWSFFAGAWLICRMPRSPAPCELALPLFARLGRPCASLCIQPSVLRRVCGIFPVDAYA